MGSAPGPGPSLVVRLAATIAATLLSTAVVVSLGARVDDGSDGVPVLTLPPSTAPAAGSDTLVEPSVPEANAAGTTGGPDSDQSAIDTCIQQLVGGMKAGWDVGRIQVLTAAEGSVPVDGDGMVTSPLWITGCTSVVAADPDVTTTDEPSGGPATPTSSAVPAAPTSSAVSGTPTTMRLCHINPVPSYEEIMKLAPTDSGSESGSSDSGSESGYGQTQSGDGQSGSGYGSTEGAPTAWSGVLVDRDSTGALIFEQRGSETPAAASAESSVVRVRTEDLVVCTPAQVVAIPEAGE